MEGTDKPQSDAIIVVSSDDDEDEDVQEIFKAFVTKVEQFVAQREVTLLLRMKFLQARREIVSSAKFKSDLKWRTKKLDKTNAYFYTGEILNLLAADSKQDVKSKADSEKIAVDVEPSFSGNGDAAIHAPREVAGQNKNIIQVTIDNSEEDKPATRVEKITAQLARPRASTSSASPSTSKGAETKKTNKKKRREANDKESSSSKPTKLPLTPRKRKRLVRRLEEKLKHISERVRILNQAELSLDEMNMCDSTYIQECRLKDRFNRIWDKICRIQGRPSDTGRVIEKEVKCPPTGFLEIDRAVTKFLKEKRGRFPDKFDISNVILETKKRHGLKISSPVLGEISEEIFICIGNTLQKRRKLDFKFNFGCSLTDDYDSSEDPASNDSSLRKKLEENKKVNKRALDEVFEKFTHYGRMRNHEGSADSSSSESENAKPEKSTEGKTKRRFSRISMAESSDSSDKECDHFGLEVEGSSDNDPSETEDMFDRNLPSVRKIKKMRSALRLRDNNNDLDDFAIKKPCRTMEKPNAVVVFNCESPSGSNVEKIVSESTGASDNICSTESNAEIDADSNVASQSNKIDLSSNCAVVELPPSVLSESIDVTVEQTSVSEIHQESGKSDPRGTQPGGDGTAVEPDVNNKDAATSVLEGCEISSVHNISQCSSKHDPSSDSAEKLDSKLDKEDLITTMRSSDISSPVSSSVAVTSDSSNFVVDAESSTQTCSNEKRVKGNLDAVSSENHKSVAGRLSKKPSLVIHLSPVSTKGLRSSLLSLSTKKRKAENGPLDSESPLKIFRKATLEIVGKQNNITSSEMDASKQAESCEESTVSCRNESDELSFAVSTANSLPNTINGHPPLRNHRPRKLTLSLNKTGRNSPKKPNVPADVSNIIVLSDDSDS